MNPSTNWIWSKKSNQQKFYYLHFRRSIQLESLPEKAIIHITANQVYRLYVNGKFIGRGPDRADPRHPFFDPYEIQAHLVEGKNTISIDTYGLEPNDELGRFWCLSGGEPALAAEVILSNPDQIIATDQQWKVLTSPIWKNHDQFITRFLGYIEHVDGNALQSLKSYHAVDFDDDNWENANVLGAIQDHPFGLGDPRVKEIPFLTPTFHNPVSIYHQQAETVTENINASLGHQQYDYEIKNYHNFPTQVKLDFGRSMGGMFQIELKNCEGGRLEILYGETGHQNLVEIIELPDQGDLEFESFDWRGARYVSLIFSNLKNSITIQKTQFKELRYPFNECGDFNCNESKLGKIWRMSRLTAHIGVKDHLQDCIGREQAFWLEDALVHCETLLHCFGDTTAIKKALKQTVLNMREDGLTQVPGPVALGYKTEDAELNWSEQPLSLPLTIEKVFNYTGDKNWLKGYIDPLIRLLSFYQKYINDDGLIQANKPGQQTLVSFAGWSRCLDRGIPSILNIKYYTAMNTLSKFLELLGDERAGDYSKQSNDFLLNIKQHLYDPSRGLFIDGILDEEKIYNYDYMTNALALIYGLVPPEDQSKWAESISDTNLIGRMLSPFVATKVLEAYFMIKREDLAKNLIQSCWGHFVDQSEPTIPERMILNKNNAMQFGGKAHVSPCHPYGSGPAYLFPKYIAGIRPTSPGCQNISMAPMDFKLDLLRGRYPTPHGEISYFWRKDASEWYFEIELPKNIQFTLHVPTKGVDGTIHYQNELMWASENWPTYWNEYLKNHGKKFRDETPDTFPINLSGTQRHHITLSIA